MTLTRLAIGASLLLAFAPACNAKHANATPRPESMAAKAEAPVAARPAAPTAAPAAPTPASDTVEINISSVKDLMKFDTAQITVKTGTKCHVSFHSNATMDVLPHNWVLVNPGTEAAVALAGLQKGLDANYIDPGPNVLAYTPLAKPGQTVETTFTAPAPGTYSYICTCPGHYMMMHGKLIVTS